MHAIYLRDEAGDFTGRTLRPFLGDKPTWALLCVRCTVLRLALQPTILGSPKRHTQPQAPQIRPNPWRQGLRSLSPLLWLRNETTPPTKPPQVTALDLPGPPRRGGRPRGTSPPWGSARSAAARSSPWGSTPRQGCGIKGFFPTSVTPLGISPFILGASLWETFLLYHRSGFHFPQPCSSSIFTLELTATRWTVMGMASRKGPKKTFGSRPSPAKKRVTLRGQAMVLLDEGQISLAYTRGMESLDLGREPLFKEAVGLPATAVLQAMRNSGPESPVNWRKNAGGSAPQRLRTYGQGKKGGKKGAITGRHLSDLKHRKKGFFHDVSTFSCTFLVKGESLASSPSLASRCCLAAISSSTTSTSADAACCVAELFEGILFRLALSGAKKDSHDYSDYYSDVALSQNVGPPAKIGPIEACFNGARFHCEDPFRMLPTRGPHSGSFRFAPRRTRKSCQPAKVPESSEVRSKDSSA